MKAGELDDYSGAFEPNFSLERLSAAALARLGREYMLHGHTRDRALMPLVGIRFGPAASERLSILEWLGASPVYTRRMRRAMRIEGDDVPAIIKAFQLDVGFPHRYMVVRWTPESATVGHFQLASCGALLDVEPFGERQVYSTCHTIEDPTFDASATATNPRARARSLHRPPRTPADRTPHCAWTIAIDADNEPIAEHEMTKRVAASVLADFQLWKSGTGTDFSTEKSVPVPDLRRVVADAPPADCGGLDDYSGPVEADFELERLSHPALVTVCKEFLLQIQLLERAAAIGLTGDHGPEATRELQRAAWRAMAPLTTRRLCHVLAIDGGDVRAAMKMLQTTPILPHDYLRLGFELRVDPPADTPIERDARVDDDGSARSRERGRVWIEDCVALDDAAPRGLLDLLFEGEADGLRVMVRAVAADLDCRRVEDRDGRPQWEVFVNAEDRSGGDPEEAAFVATSTVATANLEPSGR